MQIHELTTVNNVESTDYVAVDNGTATRKYNLGTALQYKSGDTISGPFMAFGHCTVNSTMLRLLIPLSKYIKNDLTIVPNITTLQIRGIKADMSGGGYAGGSSTYQLPATATQGPVNTAYNKQGVVIDITLASGDYGLANNSPVAGMLQGSITFN